MTGRPPSSNPPRKPGAKPIPTPAPGQRPLSEFDDATEGLALGHHRREAAARLVIAFYRLVKSCQLYDTSNEAVQQLAIGVVQALVGYCGLYETETARVLFSKDQVFVNRRLMRASRETFALALQLGTWLEACYVNEITFERGMQARSPLALARLLVDGQRGPAAAQAVADCNLPGISIRRSAGLDADDGRNPDESATARVIKSYAASVLILRSFHEQLGTGNSRGAHEVKRIAQKLVAISEAMPELLVSIASGALVDNEPARRAVSTAVISLAMTRFLTTDRGSLTTIVQAALLADAGAAWQGSPLEPAMLATRTLGVLALIGEFHTTSLRRSVVAYEALHPVRGPSTRSLGAERTMLATVLFIARRFNEIRTPYPGVPPRSIDSALSQLQTEAKEPTDQACVRLLIRSLGLYPAGTLVELNTGELAVVTGAPATTADFARPPVQLMTDAHKGMLPEPIEMDLARQPPADRRRSIRRPMEMTKPTIWVDDD